MGSRCYYCGEGFGRCYEHAGNDCPPDCGWGVHSCPDAEYWRDVEDSEMPAGQSAAVAAMHRIAKAP